MRRDKTRRTQRTRRRKMRARARTQKGGAKKATEIAPTIVDKSKRDEIRRERMGIRERYRANDDEYNKAIDGLIAQGKLVLKKDRTLPALPGENLTPIELPDNPEDGVVYTITLEAAGTFGKDDYTAPKLHNNKWYSDFRIKRGNEYSFYRIYTTAGDQVAAEDYLTAKINLARTQLTSLKGGVLAGILADWRLAEVLCRQEYERISYEFVRSEAFETVREKKPVDPKENSALEQYKLFIRKQLAELKRQHEVIKANIAALERGAAGAPAAPSNASAPE